MASTSATAARQPLSLASNPATSRLSLVILVARTAPDLSAFGEMSSSAFAQVEPGTGEPHNCDRCGRAHEVHATVELGDGLLAVVGTGFRISSPRASTSRSKSRVSRISTILAIFIVVR